MKTMAKLFTVGLGVTCGVGAIVAFAPSDVEVVEPSETNEVSETSEPLVVEGEMPSETSTPEVAPAPEPEAIVAIPEPPACAEGLELAEDGTCVDPSFWDTTAPAPQPVYEDDPAWDCRIHGNRICGVDISGTRYLVQFDEAGNPLTITAS